MQFYDAGQEVKKQDTAPMGAENEMSLQFGDYEISTRCFTDEARHVSTGVTLTKTKGVITSLCVHCTGKSMDEYVTSEYRQNSDGTFDKNVCAGRLARGGIADINKASLSLSEVLRDAALLAKGETTCLKAVYADRGAGQLH